MTGERCELRGHLHELKCWPEWYERIADGTQRAMLRDDDRDPRFVVGDVIWLREYEPTAPEILARAGRDYRRGVMSRPAGETFPDVGTYSDRSCLLRINDVLRRDRLPWVPDDYALLTVTPQELRPMAAGFTASGEWTSPGGWQIVGVGGGR